MNRDRQHEVLWLDRGSVTGHDDGKPSRVPTVVPQAFIMCIEIESSDPRVLSYGPGKTCN